MLRKILYVFASLVCLCSGLIFVSWWKLPKHQVYTPPRDFDLSTATAEPLFNIKISDRLGCMNSSGLITIEPKYDDIRCSSDRLVPFEENGLWGYLSQAGEVILTPQFSLASHGYSNNFSNGLAVVCQNSKCGYINESGKYAIEPKFDWAGHFYEGRAIAGVGSANLLGWQYKAPTTVVIDTKGDIVFGEPRIYPEDNFSEGLANARVGGERATVDARGAVAFFTKGRGVEKFSEGLAVFGTRELYRFGYVDKNGEVVIPQQFKQAGDFSDGLATVMFENGKYGYIDRSGKTVIEPEYDVADTFYEGRAVVANGSKKGYIDRTGSRIIPLQFGSAERFKDGLARVSFDNENPPYENKKYGYIDRDGRFVLDPLN